MTANELADELTKMFRGEEYDRLVHEIPDLLRQQTDRINVLEANHRVLLHINDKALKYIKGLEEKIINLSFDLEYAKRTDEFVKKVSDK